MDFIEHQVYATQWAPKVQVRVTATEEPATTKGTSFLFVNSRRGETPQHSRQSLRSHVMQQARSKRKWSTSKGAVNSPGPSISRRNSSTKPTEQVLIPLINPQPMRGLDLFSGSDADADDSTETPANSSAAAQAEVDLPTGSQAASSWSLSIAPTFNSFPQSPAADHHISSDCFFLDPYASLPVKLDALSRGMLDQYLSSLNQCFTLQGRSERSISQAWFLAAFASRAFMYSLLCAAATHQYALNRIQYHAVLKHESFTVQEVASTLSDPILSVTDGNIAAVFNLMCVDEAFLTSFEAQSSIRDSVVMRPQRKRVHSNGLEQMVRVRGGLLKLRHNPCLFSFLLWHATEHSVASFQPSPFFPDLDELASVLDQFAHSSGKPDVPKRLARLLLASGSPHRLVAAARNAIVLARQFDAWLAEDPKSLSYTDMGDFSALLIQSLLRFLHLQVEFDPMSEAIATAMIMFIGRKSNDTRPLFDPLHIAATKWLQHGLRCAPDADWDPDVRLWVTAVGAICARGSSEALEIEHAFVWACQAWDIRTLDQLLDALNGVLWIRARFDSGAEQLWVRWKDRILER